MLIDDIARPIARPVVHGGAPPAGTTMWLDAASPQDLTLRHDGGTGYVAAWADRSGNGNDAVQETEADQPVYLPGAINGKPAVKGDGSSDYLSADSVAAVVSGTDKPWSVLMAMAVTQTGVNVQMFNWGNSSSNTPIIGASHRSTNDWRLEARDDASTNKSTTPAGAVALGNYIHTIVSSGTALTWRVNGTPIYSEMDIDLGVMTVDQFSLFVLRGSTSVDFCKMHLGEFILYNRALTEAEYVSAESYLSERWGVFF